MAQSPPDDLEVFLNDLQKKFERLKVLYEQYFMGIERIEPGTLRKDVSRNMLDLQQTFVRNTSLRFKTATLIQKWNMYQSYWNRTVREIEQGRYIRHVATARRHALRAGIPFPEEEMGLRKGFAHLPESLVSEPGAQQRPEEAPAKEDTATPPPQRDKPRPPAPRQDGAAAQAPRPSPSPSSASQRALQLIPGMADTEVRELHQRVVSAQRQLGESVEMRFESLVSQLAKQVPKLLSEHGCTEVRFDVVTKNGKVKLKPSPVK